MEDIDKKNIVKNKKKSIIQINECDDGLGNLTAMYYEGFLGINKVEPRL